MGERIAVLGAGPMGLAVAYQLARDGHELGIHALAVPLRNMQGQTLAALNVVGTADQLSGSAVERKWLPLLLEAARELRPLL
jgi:IclR family pca regulon transcriptional regulator